MANQRLELRFPCAESSVLTAFIIPIVRGEHFRRLFSRAGVHQSLHRVNGVMLPEMSARLWVSPRALRCLLWLNTVVDLSSKFKSLKKYWFLFLFPFFLLFILENASHFAFSGKYGVVEKKGTCCSMVSKSIVGGKQQ